MRIISGRAKGFILKVPQRKATRPATELVRGAIFSMLMGLASSWDNVLDIFSGSGSLGIEALSRGAGWVDFVEHEPRCCAIIKQNLQKTGFSEDAKVHCCTVTKALGLLDKEYDIILADPPYRDHSVGVFLEKLASSSLVGDNTVLVVTHSPRLTLDDGYGKLKKLKEHRHGDSIIAIYIKEANS